MWERLKRKEKRAADVDTDEEEKEEGDDDVDYEEDAGEFALYDSPLENTDELDYVKEAMDTIHADQDSFQYIMSSLTEAERNTFAATLEQATELRKRE